MNCPNCKQPIDQSQINIQADIAQCNYCGSIFKISDTLNNSSLYSFDAKKPPKGAWFKKENCEIIIGASTRSPIAFFLVPFWAFSFIAVIGIFSSILLNSENFLFISLIGIPFLLFVMLFGSFAIMNVAGEVEITLNNSGGEIYTGISGIGLNRKFKWEEISTVNERVGNFVQYPGVSQGAIVLEGKKRIVFASNLNESRRYFVFKALQFVLNKQKTRQSIF